MLIRSMRKIKIVWVYLSPKCAAVTHLVKSYKRKEINIPKFKKNFSLSKYTSYYYKLGINMHMYLIHHIDTKTYKTHP